MFVFSLAKELGMTVEYIMNNMSSEELTYWKAFSELEREEMECESKKAEMMSKMRR
jgi:hypothetical protein